MQNISSYWTSIRKMYDVTHDPLLEDKLCSDVQIRQEYPIVFTEILLSHFYLLLRGSITGLICLLKTYLYC